MSRDADRLVVMTQEPGGETVAVEFEGRAAAWLRFMRWLYQTGRLTEWPPESTEV
ncbi:MAG TPA: hypothetical protein VF178_12690 [Gemmatimonadaceae bacterium]